MRIQAYLSTISIAVAAFAAPLNVLGATVNFQITSRFPERIHILDIFYTVTPGGEFLNWDLRVQLGRGRNFPGDTLRSSRVLDPETNRRAFDVSSGPIPVDTFANTVFSSVGAGPASYVFTEYNPGSFFPPVPAQQAPTAGAVAPNPDELNWTIFDTNTGDGNIPGHFPYHMARVVLQDSTAFFTNTLITAHFFDTTNAGVGEVFRLGELQEVPEPSAAMLAAIGLLGWIRVARARPIN